MSQLIPWGVAYTFQVALLDRTTGQHRDNPTIASGDFTRSIDSGTLSNLSNLPAVTPASTRQVQIVLSATEAECSRVTVYARDAAGERSRTTSAWIANVAPPKPTTPT